MDMYAAVKDLQRRVEALEGGPAELHVDTLENPMSTEEDARAAALEEEVDQLPSEPFPGLTTYTNTPKIREHDEQADEVLRATGLNHDSEEL